MSSVDSTSHAAPHVREQRAFSWEVIREDELDTSETFALRLVQYACPIRLSNTSCDEKAFGSESTHLIAFGTKDCATISGDYQLPVRDIRRGGAQLQFTHTRCGLSSSAPTFFFLSTCRLQGRDMTIVVTIVVQAPDENNFQNSNNSQNTLFLRPFYSASQLKFNISENPEWHYPVLHTAHDRLSAAEPAGARRESGSLLLCLPGCGCSRDPQRTPDSHSR